MLGIDPLILELETKYQSYVEKGGAVYPLFVAGAFECLGKDNKKIGFASVVQRVEPDLSLTKGPLYQNKVYNLSIEGIFEAREDALHQAIKCYNLPIDIEVIEEVPHPMLIRTDCVYRFNLFYARILSRFQGSLPV